MVSGFNFGGVSSPLIKRETKESDNSFSNEIHEMKHNCDRKDMAVKWEREESCNGQTSLLFSTSLCFLEHIAFFLILSIF